MPSTFDQQRAEFLTFALPRPIINHRPFERSTHDLRIPVGGGIGNVSTQARGGVLV